MKHGGGSILLWECFAGRMTGAIQKLDELMRKEDYLEIVKQHLKTPVWELTHDYSLDFQQGNMDERQQSENIGVAITMP